VSDLPGNCYWENLGKVKNAADGKATMIGEWVITWQRATFAPIGAQNIPAALAQKACDSQGEAVFFAMSLDDAQRRTARLHYPSGEIVELPVIEQMYAACQNDD
jgi:hypothetical protein